MDQEKHTQKERKAATALPRIFRLGTAYDAGNRIIICGEPTEAPEEWPDDDPRRHDCDKMGCGRMHVLYRLQKPLSTHCISLAFALAFAFAIPASAAPEPAVCVAVHDGDTITLRTAKGPKKIRLAAIDAPELTQPHGQLSRDWLTRWLAGQPVEFVASTSDRYGRTIARVWTDGYDVSAESIRYGHAWFYRQYWKPLSWTERSAYSQAESDARTASRGLWKAPAPLAPWLYRRAK